MPDSTQVLASILEEWTSLNKLADVAGGFLGQEGREEVLESTAERAERTLVCFDELSPTHKVDKTYVDEIRALLKTRARRS